MLLFLGACGPAPERAGRLICHRGDKNWDMSEVLLEIMQQKEDKEGNCEMWTHEVAGQAQSHYGTIGQITVREDTVVTAQNS